MATIEELLHEFQKVPDWNRFPLPEVIYEKYNLKKPRPAELNEVVSYQPPPYMSLNSNGKVDIREPAPGGVREIHDFQVLPVEVKRTNEETGDLEDYPLPDPEAVKKCQMLSMVCDKPFDYDAFFSKIKMNTTTRTYDDSWKDSLRNYLIRPKEDGAQD